MLIQSIVGRVLGPEGPVASARVEAFTIPDSTSVGTARTNEAGAYRLLTSAMSPLVVAAWRRGLRPSSAQVEATPSSSSVDAGDLHLDEGAVIWGRVAGGGGTLATISATWYGDATWRPAGEDPTLLRVGRERPIPGRVGAFRTGDGGYRISGLEPGPWRLTVTWDDAGAALDPRLADARDRLVVAPSEREDFDVSRAVLRVVVRDDAGLVEGAEVSLEGDPRITVVTHAGGNAQFVVPALMPVDLTVTAPGRSVVRRAFRSGGDGSEDLLEVRLVADPAFATVPSGKRAAEFRISVPGPDRRPIPAAVRILDPDGRAMPVRFRQERGALRYESTSRLPPDGEARFSFAGWPAGAYTIEVTAPGYAPLTKPFVLRAVSTGVVYFGDATSALPLRPR